MSLLQMLRGQWRDLRAHDRRLVGMLAAVFVLFCILDFALRVFVARDDSLRNFSSPKVPVVARVSTRESITEGLAVWFPAKVEVAVNQEKQILLQGVFSVGGESRAALALVPPDGGAPVRVRASIGQVIEGWTVERIEFGKVLLKRDAETRELLLFRSRTE